MFLAAFMSALAWNPHATQQKSAWLSRDVRLVFRRSSTGGTSTDRRYFGDQTTWNAHAKATLWLERNVGPAIGHNLTAP